MLFRTVDERISLVNSLHATSPFSPTSSPSRLTPSCLRPPHPPHLSRPPASPPAAPEGEVEGQPAHTATSGRLAGCLAIAALVLLEKHTEVGMTPPTSDAASSLAAFVHALCLHFSPRTQLGLLCASSPSHSPGLLRLPGFRLADDGAYALTS